MEALKNNNKPFILLFIFFISNLNIAKCTDYFFNGTGNYADVNLWTPSYPGTFIGTGNTVTIMAGAECTIPFGTGVFVKGSLINNGTMIVFNTFGCLDDGVFTNNGTFTHHGNVDNLGDIINNGTFTVEGNFSTQGSGDFINSSNGVFTTHTSFIASSISGNNHSFEGVFHGEGNINVEDFQNDGVISPGLSPGKMTFKDNLNLGSAGKLEIEIAGNSGVGIEGGHDQVEVLEIGNTIGNLNIDGTLEVILLGSFTPNIGNQWTIATGITSGNFSNLILPSGYNWDVDIQATAIVLEVISNSLPVELTIFRGKVIDNSILLSWETKSEKNNFGWNIEYSKNGLDWQTLEFIKGKGNTTNLNSYSFIHNNPRTENNYYRLLQMDSDGEKSYTNIIYIHFDIADNEIDVYPNPSSGIFYFTDNVERVEVIDVQGKLTLQTFIEGDEIDLNFLQTGLYYIKTVRGEDIQIIKIWKK